MTTWEDGEGVVLLPDGRRVRGRGLRRPPDGSEPGLEPGLEPDVGYYLLGSPPPAVAWESRWVPWPDFRTPRSTEDAVAALVEAHRRADRERVEVACGGGTGRTGTALALLAVLSGVPVGEAVTWVRRAYRPRAVETRWQRRWVGRAADVAQRLPGTSPSA